MDQRNLFVGEVVRLASEEPEALSAAFTRWDRDSEYRRLLDEDPAFLWSQKKIKEFLEKELEKEAQEALFFQIHTLEGDRHIGFIGLFDFEWNHRDAVVGIGIGERDARGKGYGTDAIRVLLRYAFTELNLHRVTLDVFEYNPRAIRSYEKAGFKVEGRARGMLHREGRYWDLIYMGILEAEWKALVTGD